MATDFLPGDQGEYFIALSEINNLSTQEKVAFDDVIIDKAQQGFDILTHSDNGFYIIQWKRRTN